jgi:hypothetical protein
MLDTVAWTRSSVLHGKRVGLEPLDEPHVPRRLADTPPGADAPPEAGADAPKAR